MLVSEQLNLAADLIERDGWTRGTVGMNVVGPHCLEGAIKAVTDAAVRSGDQGRYLYVDDNCPVGEAVRSYLGGRAHGGYLFIWNDNQPGAAEVIEVLRATAVIEQAREATTHPTTTPAKSGAVA